MYRALDAPSDMPAAMSGSVLISVVIPTLDEASNLPHVLTRIPDYVHEVLLVDGHSIDDTIAVARTILPDVRVLLQGARGKGNALACGFAAAAGDIIVMLDADGSTDPAEIPKFVEALLNGSDFAKGSRFVEGGGSQDITRFRRLGNRALNVTVNLLFRTRYTDLCYGYNAFWRHCLPHMRVTSTGFEVETLINVRIARAGLNVTEVPSVEYERIHGESKLNAIRDGIRALRVILRERVRRGGVARPQDWEPAYRELPPLVTNGTGAELAFAVDDGELELQAHDSGAQTSQPTAPPQARPSHDIAGLRAAGARGSTG